MPTTLQEIEELETALKQGVSSVSIEGRTVQYRSVNEIQKILTKMKSEYNKSTTAFSVSYVSYGSGL